ncbi:uncharacterized protein LOC113351504 [Papaver somniferum]|uniref:uncharacterized protein LOC113351504 n=1 Tax=Papaver somniferum TaxID=3469 RepID=UPI000E6FE081|nr:uncharacterized protein LOC113351504 [Papaver somniferum]
MQVRKDKGMCYNCDEFYRQGHRCKNQQLFMLIDDEDVEETGSLSTEEIPETSPSSSDSTIEISLHVLTENITHDTIRISGHLNKHHVVVLIDTCNTHSFIDAALTSKLGIHVSSTGQMIFTVANGDSTIIKGIFQHLNWEMQGHQFSANLRVLPLGSCDIVLGDDWLRKLGDVTFNFSLLSISFVHQGTPITLQGTSYKPSLSLLNASSLKKFLKKPKGLPPSRSLDHKISLKTGSDPTSQRPYKCPYVHKSVVESLFYEMFSSGVIQPSHSPFVAHILLVKKKDGTWRFCIDYRKHNDITFKDKFLIPLIEELLDELNVLCPSMEAHLDHLQLTFALLRKHSLFAKLSKCAFSQPQLEYIGHIINANGVAADPDKVATMVNWPQPQTLKQLRGFLGFTDILKKDSFTWSDAATQAFAAIKTAMTSAPVLALSDFSQPFTLETDACSKGIGVVLMQNSKPIDFLSKPLGPKALALFTYENEFLDIVMVVQKWKHYLCSQQFIIHTDHQSLKYLMDHQLLPSASCSSLSLSQPQWVQDIISSYASDSTAQQLLTQLVVTPTQGNYSYAKGIIRFKGRLYIGSGTALRSSILHSLHASAVGGHSGINGTYHRARTSFFWPNMKTDIIQLVTTCDVC